MLADRRSSSPEGSPVFQRHSTLRITLLPIGLILSQGLGCWMPGAVLPTSKPFGETGCCLMTVDHVVETLVAEPTATLDPNTGDTGASATNGARSDFDLLVFQNQTLMINLLGRASWSQTGQGRLGFYLVVQMLTDGDWTTLGSDGVSDTRSGPSSAKGRAVVPVQFSTSGQFRLRAVVRSVAEPTGLRAESNHDVAIQNDIVHIDIEVLAAPNLMPQDTNRPTVPQDDGWLQPDPPPVADMVP